ncbi:MAG: carbohydrate kinase family protein [Candidatus Bathyarchaeia archaeon]
MAPSFQYSIETVEEGLLEMLVTCAGILVVDIIAADLPKVSDPGELIFTPRSIEVHLGGHSGNVSIDLRKLGLEKGYVSSIGAIGEDLFGDFLEAQLKAYGIITHLQRVPNVATSKDLILVVKGEDRRYHVDVGANWFLSPDHVLSVVSEEKPKIFYAGGVGLTGKLDEHLPEVLLKIKNLGSLTFIDPVTPYGRGWGFLIPTMKWTDIFHCNIYEAKQITGRHNPHEAARALIEKGASLVVISHGDGGLRAETREYSVEMPAFRVPVVDPTGAGDALCAGIMSGLLKKMNRKHGDIANLSVEDLVDILLEGEAAGAACVTMVGTTTAVTRKNVDKILKEQGEILKRNVKVSPV